MNLIIFDYVLLGIVAVIIANHVVFMMYEKLRSRDRGKKDGGAKKTNHWGDD